MQTKTAVPWLISCAGLGGFVVGFAMAWPLRQLPAAALVVLIACTGAPMWWLEWRRHRESPEHVTDRSRGDLKLRCEWRLRGLMVAAGLWLLTLSALPLANRYAISGFWGALSALWPLPLLAMIVYVFRAPQGEPYGLELTGRWWTHRNPGEPFPWYVLRDQLVKAFFLPLMVAFAYDWAHRAGDWGSEPVLGWYFSTIALLYLIDTVFGTIGYLSTTRPLDAHIRSSNPYLLGWAAALACYPPFFTWLQQAGFNYRDGKEWMDWLGLSHPLLYVWGSAVLLLTAIYALSTVVFGVRFSNLTNRGIITHGPYRYTKHPAYISKNISWWLISVPFVSKAGAGTAAVHCAILVGMNGIYWVRAKTEERHLMQDLAYREYAAWIAEHGLFARLRRKFAFATRERQHGI